ncbi:hypothetical protein HYU07_02095 [Candidatus Woesearchaeota archaeon]|nr:hypothetical protein [Candidatus Woesearchaeota archaeon]
MGVPREGIARASRFVSNGFRDRNYEKTEKKWSLDLLNKFGLNRKKNEEIKI